MKHASTPALPTALRRESDGAELEAVWNLIPEGETARSPEETDAAWASFTTRAAGFPVHGGSPASPAPVDAADRSARRTSGGSRRGWMGVLLRTAAVAVLALGATVAWYAVPVTHRAAAGERIEFALPDGSRVALNAGSTLRHRRSFSWLPGLLATNRNVKLQGEAFFDVASAVRPFMVEAGAARVRVLGTRFNVRARGSSGVARVDVEEGRVEVRDPLRAFTLILGAGEAARMDPASGDLSREEIDEGRVAPWRSGGMVMVDEPLAGILQELGLRFDTPILLRDGTAADALLSVYYSRVSSLESVLSDLATQQDLRYRRTSDGWELF